MEGETLGEPLSNVGVITDSELQLGERDLEYLYVFVSLNLLRFGLFLEFCSTNISSTITSDLNKGIGYHIF